jgi:hypothetical protein
VAEPVRVAALLLAVTAAACDRSPDVLAAPASSSLAAETSAVTAKPVASAPARPQLLAERLILSEWSKAENRAKCAPLGFTGDGGKGGEPRRAYFGGGWAVAFDLPGKRSAYGLAGVGLLPDDEAAESAQRERLINQWPSFVDLTDLPQPAYAGYGVEGGTAWREDDPQALASNALAYVRVGGQTCQYNVWSRLGRAHLERLLSNLRVIGRTLN